MQKSTLPCKAAILSGLLLLSPLPGDSPWIAKSLQAETQPPKTTDSDNDFSLERILHESELEPGAPGQFLIPFEKLKYEQLNDLPIGVFDSGIGGLTVLETILGLDAYHNHTARPGPDGIPDFEGEKFIYFGDQANMPYGNYASRGDVNFLRELIVRDAMFLLGTKSWQSPAAPEVVYSKPPVKAIVIACNTATAFGLSDIRAAIEGWRLTIPVIGVVEAGANSLVQQLPSKGPAETIAVMATLGTCSSNAYPKAISKAAGQAGKRVPLVIQQGSIGLAGAIEGNPSFVQSNASDAHTTVPYQGPSSDNPNAKIQPDLATVYAFQQSGLITSQAPSGSAQVVRLNSVDNYVRFDVVEMVDRYSKQFAPPHSQTPPITKVILGCTHFPFESEMILGELTRLRDLKREDGSHPYRNLLAEEIQIIDPAELTAKELYKTLLARRLGRIPFIPSTEAGSESSTEYRAKPEVSGFYFSVANPANQTGLDADGNLTNDYKYGRKPGWANKEDTLPVPLEIENMPDALSKLLKEKCQHIWAELSKAQVPTN